MRQTRLVLCSSLVLLLASGSSLADELPNIDRRNIRITEPRLRQILDAGVSSSPTLRSLVDRLDGSDVVVYLQTDLQGSSGVAGRLTLLSVVGDIRYVVIRLTPLRSVVQQLAMIGHELQHAVEVADSPEIVDPESMLREYTRIGQLIGGAGSGITVDTAAAMDAGKRISDELRRAPLPILPGLLP